MRAWTWVFGWRHAGTPFACGPGMACVRRGSRSRGGTCVELAILLGIFGAMIIFVASVSIRKLTLAQRTRDGGVAMCR